MLFCRQNAKKTLLHATVACLAAGIITGTALFFIPEPQVVPPPPLHHTLQEECVCLSAATPAEPVPQTIDSDTPHLRIREYAPGQYELLYWGNPVRPRYVFSITNTWDGATALQHPNGQPQRYRDLVVTTPPGQDQALPLQPIIKLHHMRGKPGAYYSARIYVHDAANGKVLCSALYLICGNSPN